MTAGKSFFTTYKLLESSVKMPVGDIIFEHLQPLNITEILVQEYESEVDYASPILELLNIFHDLCHLAKKFNSGVDIGFSLIELENRLLGLHRHYTIVFYFPNDDWFIETYKPNSASWWDSIYCCVIFHACRLLLYRLLTSSSSYEHDPNIPPSLFSAPKFAHYFEQFGKSAILLSKLCSSATRLQVLFFNMEFCVLSFQCTGALLLMASIYQSKKDKSRYNDMMNLINENWKFINCHRKMYAHIPPLLNALENLKERILSTAKQQNLRHVFDYAHETLDVVVASIISRDMSLETGGLDEYTNPTYRSDVNDAIPTDIQILNDVFNKFAL